MSMNVDILKKDLVEGKESQQNQGGYEANASQSPENQKKEIQ